MSHQEELLITNWMRESADGDAESANRLFHAYFQKMVRLARQRLSENTRRVVDEEDVALDAFKSFFNALQRDRFPDLMNREDLWRLLFCIVLRKAADETKKHLRLKRGGGDIRGESVFAAERSPGIDGFSLDSEPSPAAVAEFTEQTRKMLDSLDSDELRKIALLKMEGHTNAEIAAKLDFAERSIERKLHRIRSNWQDEFLS